MMVVSQGVRLLFPLARCSAPFLLLLALARIHLRPRELPRIHLRAECQPKDHTALGCGGGCTLRRIRFHAALSKSRRRRICLASPPAAVSVCSTISRVPE